MKAYRASVIMGLVLALLLSSASLAGYGVVLYKVWWMVLFAVILLATRVLKCRPSIAAYFCAVAILVVLSTAGAFAGHWARRIHCHRKCTLCKPILELVQKHRADHGHYPAKLMEVQGFALARRNAGLRIGEGGFSKHGITLHGINSHDALICLDTNYMLCVVPVTKQLPMSFTRFYAYWWSTDSPSWKYDKSVSFLGDKDN